MTWFRRDQHSTPPPPEPSPEQEAAALQAKLQDCYAHINGGAGRLPAESVLAALHVCDLLAQAVDVVGGQPVDVTTTIAIERMLDDYLPTTLRTCLSAGTGDRADALRAQLRQLADAATDILDTARQRDSDAIRTQSSFLHTKFSRSDLEL
ncbi:hypothetical protein [Kutzneria sp. 744]|jgi:hypothetical protein|uniref:hypothetical protein n=1 Tax=Kutzneria sp. (strain 744) TaxID=345341 RepID=UPI0003EEC1CD|nr:hypothetical protein [Kutzneria sp. 744]EWM12896.1 hypothetical protein KUTG_03200 [Kutzneria sp. 744]